MLFEQRENSRFAQCPLTGIARAPVIVEIWVHTVRLGRIGGRMIKSKKLSIFLDVRIYYWLRALFFWGE